MSPRRRTFTRRCTGPGPCTATSVIEYTARRELDHLPREWTCPRHAAPDEWMTPTNPTTTTVLELQPRYLAPFRQGEEPRLLGYFWGPPGQQPSHGSLSGPGFKALADNFPPGTRLTVTATITLPQGFTVTDAEPPPPETISPRRQAAYDAVYELIRNLGPELPPDPVHRNAMIWRAVNAALDAAGLPVTADPAHPSGDTVPPAGDTVPATGDTAGDTVLAAGGHVRATVPGDGRGDGLTNGVPGRRRLGDTGDTEGTGVRFAYAATVPRSHAVHALAEAFALLDAELHPNGGEGEPRE